MNRHARRAQQAQTQKVQTKVLKLNQETDIQIDAKGNQVVMVMANAQGRTVVERLWPGAQWSRDETFAQFKPADWKFTHIRVTKLPPDLEAKVPLTSASPDSIGLAVAAACQKLLPARRVAQFTGAAPEVTIKFVEASGTTPESGQTLAAEYVPANTWVGRRPGE